MRKLKIILMVALPMILFSCNEGANQRNQENQRDKDSNRNMQPERDTISEGSFLIFSDRD